MRKKKKLTKYNAKYIKPVRNITRTFFPIILVVLLITTFAAQIFADLLYKLLQIEIEFTIYVWTLLFSIIIGGTLSYFISRLFISPIDKLSKSMNNVANGDFETKIEDRSVIYEIDCMINNFNLMVKELNTTEILQSDFISAVSHEFKTPIGSIEGYVTLLQDESISQEDRAEYLQRILISTRRLNTLISNILLISKVENKQIDASKKQFSLDEQIRQCILVLEPKWSEKNIEPDIDLQPINYVGNENILNHVWLNLIDNAIKFGKENGYIKVRLFSENQKIIFSVEDNGCGISEEKIKHVFDKFYQCDSSHRSEGNGLGLALVKKVLDEYGAEITCENCKEGGCIFTVTLY
ncbi:MAG: HAMP domain-containing histidine kinase [Clostridia bacterium]|nr:HAMP domain-containing histidine kinase [Clostridia bacterium]